MSETGYKKEMFFRIYDEITGELGKDKEYAELRKETDRIRNENPFLTELYEGEHTEERLELNGEERKAVHDFLRMREEMADMVERGLYWRGHRDCIRYLMKCGILKKEAE